MGRGDCTAMEVGSCRHSKSLARRRHKTAQRSWQKRQGLHVAANSYCKSSWHRAPAFPVHHLPLHHAPRRPLRPTSGVWGSILQGVCWRVWWACSGPGGVLWPVAVADLTATCCPRLFGCWFESRRRGRGWGGGGRPSSLPEEAAGSASRGLFSASTECFAN